MSQHVAGIARQLLLPVDVQLPQQGAEGLHQLGIAAQVQLLLADIASQGGRILQQADRRQRQAQHGVGLPFIAGQHVKSTLGEDKPERLELTQLQLEHLAHELAHPRRALLVECQQLVEAGFDHRSDHGIHRHR
ncbi:hypothetical protein D3C76_1522880 [compost metagenome]